MDGDTNEPLEAMCPPLVDDENIHIQEVPLMLPPSDWRVLHCSSSRKLREPATEDEKLVWEYMLLPLEHKKGGCLEEFEDPDGK